MELREEDPRSRKTLEARRVAIVPSARIFLAAM